MYQFDTSNLRDFGLPRPRASTIARLNEKARLRREAAEREAAAREASRLALYRKLASEAIRKGRETARKYWDDDQIVAAAINPYAAQLWPGLRVSYGRLAPAEPPTLEELLSHVSLKHGITVLDLKSARRTKPICIARHEMFWLARNFTTCSLPQIGRAVGLRDHSTVLHGVRRHQARIDAGEVEADRTFER